MPEEDGTFVNAKEAARLLGVSDATVRRAIAQGLIPAQQLGRVYRIPRSFVAGVRDRVDGLGRVGTVPGDGRDDPALLLEQASRLIARALALVGRRRE
jgi:excisionase family DNA binding protein